jgi:putative membrane protein
MGALEAPMLLLAYIAYWIVILLHVYFAVLEMALWKSRGPKLFGMTQDFANQSARLASNQGLYNLFLVAALLIGFFAPDETGAPFAFFGLGCVIVAGIWGGMTVGRKIFFVQAVPAIVAVGLRLLLIS